MHQFLGAIGRKCSVVNLDPANDHTSYPCALDVRDLVTLEEIMEEDTLGPNGGVLYALEELEHNIEWLTEGLKQLGGRPYTARRFATETLTAVDWYRGLRPLRLPRPGRAVYAPHLVTKHLLPDPETRV